MSTLLSSVVAVLLTAPLTALVLILWGDELLDLLVGPSYQSRGESADRKIAKRHKDATAGAVGSTPVRTVAVEHTQRSRGPFIDGSRPILPHPSQVQFSDGADDGLSTIRGVPRASAP